MFLHKKSDELASYRKLETDAGNTLKLTDYHLIYVNDCELGQKLQLVHAKDVKIGQCVYAVDDERITQLRANKVAKISMVGCAAKGFAGGLE